MQTMTQDRGGSRPAQKKAAVGEPDGMQQRVSVSLTEEQYEFLGRLAKAKKVSLAWVIRDAIDRLLEGDGGLEKGSIS